MLKDKPRLQEGDLISSFLSGLNAEIRLMIQLLKPHHLNDVFEQALFKN